MRSIEKLFVIHTKVCHVTSSSCYRVEADLGKFSEAIYKKLMQDAKQQRYQGFRPGTVPLHLEPTYRAFAMDECARETVLEAMEQNNVRPFTDARNDFVIENVSIPPPIKKKGGAGKKSKKRKTGTEESEEPVMLEEVLPQWRSFQDMSGAIAAGWKVSNLHVLFEEAANYLSYLTTPLVYIILARPKLFF
jgi:hypothetical protein